MSDELIQTLFRRMAAVDANLAGKLRSEFRRLAMTQTGYGVGMSLLAVLEGAQTTGQFWWLRVFCMAGFIFLAAFSYFAAVKSWYHGNQAYSVFMQTREMLLRCADAPGCP